MWEDDGFMEAKRFAFQAKLFQYLAMQYIAPAATLRKLLEPENVDRQGSKIAVMNGRKESLGHLSLEDDRLYFCVVPLLKNRLAQMKMVVREVEINQKVRPYRAKADVDFYIRIEEGADGETGGGLNLQIADILADYEKFLKKPHGM